MRLITVNPRVLLPIETDFYNLEEFLKIFKPALVEKEKNRVLVVSYQEERRRERYVISDGHHRSAILYLCGEEVPIKILETDEEVNCEKGALFYRTKEEFLWRSEMVWRPRVESRGIKSLPDLLRYAYHPSKLRELQEKAQSIGKRK